MNDEVDTEKRKYLKRAKQLLQKPQKPIKKLQASVEPFPRCGTTTGPGRGSSTVLMERSHSDPTPTVTTAPGPLIQRVTPTRRRDMGSAELPSPSSAKFLNHSEPHMHRTLDDSGSGRGSRTEQERSTPSPRYGNAKLHFPAFVEDLNHMCVSTPLPRTREYTTNQKHHFTTDSTPEQLSAMTSRCSELESRLRIQMDINKELKRLLVASMGSDLQHCLNHIAEEKATISEDLDVSLQRLAENYEEIDRVSIECDIWRSKFLASRLMIDELAGWKAEETRQLRESQRALQCMLKEHAELRNSLLQCNHHLGELAAHSKSSDIVDDKLSNWPPVDLQESTVVELAKAISSQAKLLHKQIGDVENGKGSAQSSNPHVHGKATTGERLAQQVLSGGSAERHIPSPSRLGDKPHLPSPSRLGDKPLGGSWGLSSPRSTYQQYLLHSGTVTSILFHCNHCKGKIYNV